MTPFDTIRFCGRSDIGRKRKNNEDNFGTFPALGVWLVADGMGGGDDGEVASAAVVREVDELASACPQPETGAYAAEDVVKGVESAVNKASQWIFRRTREKRLTSCGSTVVGCALDAVNPGQAIAFHAGDSRLYRLRGRGIRQITVDHSAAEMIGVKDESKVNPMFRGMVLRAVGVKPAVEIELTPFDVKKGDRILICSDGLSRMVKDRKIAAISAKEQDVENAVAALIAAANEAGGVDNITAVMIEIGVLPPPATKAMFPESGESATADGTSESATSDTGTGGTDSTRMTIAPPDEIEQVGEVESDLPKVEPQTSHRKRLWLIASAVLGVVLVAALCALVARVRHVESADAARESEAKKVTVVSQPVVKPVKPKPAAKSVESKSAIGNPPTVVNPPAVVQAIEPNPPESAKPAEPKPQVAAEPVAPKPVETVRPVEPKPMEPVVPEGCEELARQCGKENLVVLSGLVRRKLSAEKALEFGEQMKRAQSSAQAVFRLKTAKTASRFLVDLKYAFQTVPEIRKSIAENRELARAWDLVADGDVESAEVRRAAARVLKDLSGELR